MSDYVELTGDELAQWMDAPPAATCNRCARKTWDADAVDTEDRMIQPDNNPCGGRFIGSAA